VISSPSGGTLLRDLPLHTYTLAKVSVLYRALAHLTFGVVCLLGRSENGNATREDSAMLRLLTPVAKGFAASYAVGGMEECMIALGGQGYMEETGIGR
jgi:alkylation response protein AidB-like acyl-CoA dehydrogenase